MRVPLYCVAVFVVIIVTNRHDTQRAIIFLLVKHEAMKEEKTKHYKLDSWLQLNLLCYKICLQYPDFRSDAH